MYCDSIEIMFIFWKLWLAQNYMLYSNRGKNVYRCDLQQIAFEDVTAESTAELYSHLLAIYLIENDL